jgi:CRISPR-associated endonuclease Csn1
MNMSTSKEARTILGLDIGVASLGWCLLACEGKQPVRILGTGSRIFSPGVDGDFANGRDEPKNQARRDARQSRRQLWRRQRRMLKLFRALVRAELLPDPGAYGPDDIDQSLKTLDAQLTARDELMKDRRGAQVFHFRLRARAATECVAAHELGRALYHLAQHRGYLSNRKAAKKDGEADGEVATSISELKERVLASGLPTLGAYFASIDPEEERIRKRWLGRNEFIVPEFNMIATEQRKHHPQVTEDQWKEISDAIFRQRPLRDQSHLIGKCSLEPAERRCPVAYPEAQRFRILQAVNHLRVLEMDGEIQREARALSTQERSILLEALSRESHLTWTKARKLLSLKPALAKFSIELGGQKDLIGSRTEATMRVALGARWDEWDTKAKVRVIDDILEYETAEMLATRCMRAWMLTKEEANEVAQLTLESARLDHSLKAIRRMLPHLEAGLSYAEAKIAAYPRRAGAEAPWDLLPPIRPDHVWQEHCSGGREYRGIEIRNPAVERSLSEVRKVVNAIIRRWGKPDVVRIELARDLKKPRKERKDETTRMREQEDRRGRALGRMVKEGFSSVADRNHRSDVEKVLLWEECNGICPYTGKSISFEDLFGSQPRFEVEHIIPYSLCLEDGFGNKTLCEVNENRNIKRRFSPFDSYHGTTKWDGIAARVKLFKSRSAAKKLKLFLSESNGQDVFGDFVERQLNDTRYASRLAADYVGLLFGGRIDVAHTQRVNVSAGGATAIVRRKLGIEGVLGGGEKNRKDHRHHAVDAIAIALTGPREVQAIARASEAAIVRGEPSHRLKLDPPWVDFANDVQRSIDGIVVSHRCDRRLSGPMHQETNYSRPIRNIRREVSDQEVRHIRCGIAELTVKDVDAIVDPRVRDAVKRQLRALDEADPKKAFKGDENLPSMRHGDGRDVAIRKVRIKVRKKLDVVGSGNAKRYVAPGSNHHMAVVEVLGPSGKVVARELAVVTLLEAVRRKQRREPIVQTEWGPNRRLAFTLRSGDVVEMMFDSQCELCVVGGISKGSTEMKLHMDARPTSELKKGGKAGGRLKFAPNQLLRALRRKVDVRPLGTTCCAND